MGIKLLDHVNIRTEHFEETLRFYKDVLGMHSKPLVNKDFAPGTFAWVYDSNDVAVLHISAVQRDHPERIKWQEDRLGRLNHRIPDHLQGTGAIDHIALQGDDYEACLKHVQALGIVYQEVGPFNTPNGEIRQVNVRDPNGIVVEVTFVIKQPAQAQQTPQSQPA